MTTPAPLAHERAFELLPWLVTGTLQPGERDAVEQHARACILCRRELKEQRRLQAAVHGQPAIHVSAHAGLKALDREIDGAAPERPQRGWALRYAALRPFVVAAAAGLAVLAVLLWLTPLPQPGAGQYSTLATAPGGGALIDVVFAQQTTAAEIVTLLADIDGEIVAGPSAVGRYSVKVAGGQADDAKLASVIEALATDPRVRFAGRSLVEPAR